MKKLLVILFCTLALTQVSNAQYFQGTFTNTGNKLSFKMKATGSITTAISYLEVAFRYNTATAPVFTVGSLTSNTTNFPNLSMQRLPDYTDGSYTYVKFVHNTATIASRTYNSTDELEIFSITLDGDPATMDVDMSSDLVSGNYVFGVVDGAGNFLDPGAGSQLYGPGFFTSGDGQYVPLSAVPVPVRFLGFNVNKSGNNAVLNWQVENEDANTDRYEVELSGTGIEFAKTATVAAFNNGRTSNSYTFTKENISAVRNNGVLYFRIKQIDRDGRYVYTPIKSVRLDGKAFSAVAFPNPTRDITKLTIDLVDASPVLVFVTDASGKQVLTQQIQGQKGQNFRDISLASLAAGNYVIKVQAGTEVKTISVVKTN